MTTTHTIVARSQQNTTKPPRSHTLKTKTPQSISHLEPLLRRRRCRPRQQYICNNRSGFCYCGFKVSLNRCATIYACGYESSSGDEYEEVEKNEAYERCKCKQLVISAKKVEYEEIL
ncbi:hypothetical protein Tco_1397389, partial [Tanacetum coccineum]